jgi:hypothetical protein
LANTKIPVGKLRLGWWGATLLAIKPKDKPTKRRLQPAFENISALRTLALVRAIPAAMCFREGYCSFRMILQTLDLDYKL